jgi:hypothetical protein
MNAGKRSKITGSNRGYGFHKKLRLRYGSRNSTNSYPTLTARPMLMRQGHHVMFMCFTQAVSQEAVAIPFQLKELSGNKSLEKTGSQMLQEALSGILYGYFIAVVY